MPYTKDDVVRSSIAIQKGLSDIGNQIKAARNERRKNEILAKYKTGQVFTDKFGNPKASNQINAETYSDMMALNDLGFSNDAKFVGSMLENEQKRIDNMRQQQTFLGFLKPEQQRKVAGADLSRVNIDKYANYLFEKKVNDNWVAKDTEYDAPDGKQMIRTLMINKNTGQQIVVSELPKDRARRNISTVTGGFANSSQNRTGMMVKTPDGQIKFVPYGSDAPAGSVPFNRIPGAMDDFLNQILNSGNTNNSNTGDYMPEEKYK